MPGPHKRPPLSIRLPAAEEKRLRAYANRTGQPVNQVVAAAVREKLDREENSDD